MTQGSYYRPAELIGPAIQLAGRYLLYLPLAVAVGGFVAGLLIAPDIPRTGPPGWLGSFSATAAQVIGALVIALALEARYAFTSKPPAVLNVLYTAVGLVAACTGISTDLPRAAYKWTFSATVGGGLGALFAAVLVATVTIIRQVDAATAEQKREVVGDRAVSR